MTCVALAVHDQHGHAGLVEPRRRAHGERRGPAEGERFVDRVAEVFQRREGVLEDDRADVLALLRDVRRVRSADRFAVENDLAACRSSSRSRTRPASPERCRDSDARPSLLPNPR